MGTARTRVIGFLALVLIAALILPACAQAPAPPASTEPIKLGLLSPLTGSMAMTAPTLNAGAQYAVDEVNKAGGVMGRQVQLITRDTQSLPEIALREAKDLNASEGVQYLFGTILNPCATAVSAWAKEQKVFFLCPINSDTTLTAEYGHRYFFGTSMYDWAQGKGMAIEVAKQPWKKIYNIAMDFSWGHDMVQCFWLHMNQIDPTVQNVGESYPAIGTTDFTPVISKALSSGADAVFVAMVGLDWVNFIVQAKPFGFFDKVKVFGSQILEAAWPAALGKDFPEGMYSLVGAPFYYIDKTYPGAKEFDETVFNDIQTYPDPPSLNVYIGMQFVFAAMEKAQSTDVEKVIDAIEKLQLDTIVGPVHFHDYDHNLNSPRWWAMSKFTPEYPNYCITVDLVRYQDEVYMTKQEVEAARASVK
jgi:branched-chain amino acid transport system substrate-binding protein